MIWTSRPDFFSLFARVGYEDSPPLCAYGPRHREYRKLMHAGLASTKLPEIYPVAEQKMRDFLHALLTSPDNFRVHIRKYVTYIAATFRDHFSSAFASIVAAIVFHVSHGYTVSGISDPLVLLAERATLDFSVASTPGAFLVDLLPICAFTC